MLASEEASLAPGDCWPLQANYVVVIFIVHQGQTEVLFLMQKHRAISMQILMWIEVAAGGQVR